MSATADPGGRSRPGPAPEASAPVVVIGSGVIGLTTAVVLAEAGRAVTVVTDRSWADTTSRVAGAVWEPYLSAGPDVVRWAASTHTVLSRLAAEGVPGVRVGALVEGGPGEHDPPDWATAVGGVRRLGAGELRPGWDSGFCLPVPLVDMGSYLPYLVARLTAAGGAVRTHHLATVAEAGALGGGVVVNCAGLGARDLVGDRTLRPVRGQVVVVANPGLSGALITEQAGGVTYLIAHEHEVVLGGTSDIDEESVEVDARVAEAIVARAGRIDPRLQGATVVAHRVGLRPWRPTVRVELDPAPPAGVRRLVHNYGHGGSGLTLSWGCAADVAALAQA